MTAGIDVSLDLHDDDEAVSMQSADRQSADRSSIASIAGGWSNSTKDTMLARSRRFWTKYWLKFGGVPDQSPSSGHDWAFCAWAGVGTLLALLLLTGMERKIKTTYLFSGENLGFEQAGVFWPVVFINSMAGVAGMLFAAPSSPLIQPRMLIGGHMIAASSAICADYLSNPQRGMDLLPRWVATPLAPALTILIQSKVGLLHPPACAAAVIFMEGEAEIKNMDWLFVLCPVLLDCVLLVACAVVINNLSPNRAYPLFW